MCLESQNDLQFRIWNRGSTKQVNKANFKHNNQEKLYQICLCPCRNSNENKAQLLLWKNANSKFDPKNKIRQHISNSIRRNSHK